MVERKMNKDFHKVFTEVNSSLCVRMCVCVCDSSGVLLLTNPNSLGKESNNDLDWLSYQNNFVADMYRKMSTYQLTDLLLSCSPLQSALAVEKHNHPLL